MASPMIIAAVAILGVGILLHIIGLATPEWSVSKFGSVTWGPFRACSSAGCAEIPDQLLDGDHPAKLIWILVIDDAEEKFRAVQAMVIIGMLAGFATLGMAIYHLVMGILGRDQIKLLSLLSLIFGIVALVFILIGVIIWGAGIHNDDLYNIGYSFALSLVGGILIAVGGILVYAGGRS